MYAWNKWSRSTRLVKGRGRQDSGTLELAGTPGSDERTPMPQMKVAIPRWDPARGAVAMLGDRRASVGAAVATLAAAWCASTECSASAPDAFLGSLCRLPKGVGLPTRTAPAGRAIMISSKMGQPVATQGMMETLAGGRPRAVPMTTVSGVGRHSMTRPLRWPSRNPNLAVQGARPPLVSKQPGPRPRNLWLV